MTDELQKFFNFDESDLGANRLGKLSAKQKNKLENAEKGSDRIFIGAGIFFILVAIVIILFVLGSAASKFLSGTNLTSSDMLNITLGTCLPTIFFGLFAYVAFYLGISKLDNTVKNANGKVDFVKVAKQILNHNNPVNKHQIVQQNEMHVGDFVFENVPEELLNIIQEGETYIFYYAKETKQILSAEKMK